MYQTTPYEVEFVYALLLTISLEMITIYATSRWLFKSPLNIKETLYGGILPSFATLPYVWFILPIFFIGHYHLYVWVAEISVTLIETVIIHQLLSRTLKDSFILSFCANLASFGFGKLIN